MRKTLIISIIIIFSFLKISYGVKFTPELKLSAQFLTKKEKKYLGLPGNCKEFKISQIKSEIKVIEFINIYCFACQKQAPEFNKFYENVKNKNIKFIGIALGNCLNEVEHFKKRFKIKFPIVPDPNYKVYEKIGGTRTPFTLILKNNKIIYEHLGFIENYKPLYCAIFGKNFKKKVVIHEHKFKTLKLTDNFIIQKIKPKFNKIEDVKKFKNYYKVYADNKIYYVVAITSQSVCNICHPLQFIYIITEDGKIYDLIPIYLTKRFNKKISDREFDKLRAKLLGKSVLKHLTFNKKVDAITSATITSSMIFYFLNQAKQILPIK